MASRMAGAAREILAADRCVTFTGAGVSTESGIPDFGGGSGIWNRYDRRDLHLERFESNPVEFWATWLEFHEQVFAGHEIEPNKAHDTLVALVKAGHVEAIITQNTDGLHQAAGTPEDAVIELHGNADRVVCRSCQRRYPQPTVDSSATATDLPPRCPGCSGVLKPGVVLFSEQLPKHAHYRGHALAENADVFLVVGSSLMIEPAASLPETAYDKGATLVLINLDRTPLSGRADYEFRERASSTLSRLHDAISIYSNTDAVFEG